MSYILEALRRAESERERKRGVPGLLAQPVPMPSPDDLAERRGRPWLGVAIVLSVAVLLMVLWRTCSVEPLVDEAALARAPVAGNVAPGNAGTPTAPAAAPPAPVEPAPGAQATPSPPVAQPQPAASAAPNPAPRATRPATPPRSSATAAAPARNPPAAAAPPAPGALPAAPTPTPVPAPVPEARMRTLAELPDDLRRSVPPLAFGGSVYSDTPAQRMVIFNGQVMREGDAVSDDLQLEQIRPRSAVMRVRGQRFEVPF